MKCLSFNYKSLASPGKKLALKRLCLLERFNVIFLQETLKEGILVNSLLMSFLLDWEFHFLDVRGHFGGCTVGINKITLFLHNAWGGEGYLGTNITSSELNMPFRLINIYGPCHNRECFWHNLLDADFMQDDNLIIGGHLNFSLGLAESWGWWAQSDHLLDFFNNLLDLHDLIPIDSANILPTWRNRRTGVGALVRRLNHFFMQAPLLTSLNLFR